MNGNTNEEGITNISFKCWLIFKNVDNNAPRQKTKDMYQANESGLYLRALSEETLTSKSKTAQKAKCKKD